MICLFRLPNSASDLAASIIELTFHIARARLDVPYATLIRYLS